MLNQNQGQKINATLYLPPPWQDLSRYIPPRQTSDLEGDSLLIESQLRYCGPQCKLVRMAKPFQNANKSKIPRMVAALKMRDKINAKGPLYMCIQKLFEIRLPQWELPELSLSLR